MLPNYFCQGLHHLGLYSIFLFRVTAVLVLFICTKKKKEGRQEGRLAIRSGPAISYSHDLSHNRAEAFLWY